MSRPILFRPFMLGLVAACAIGLAACGSGSSPSSGSDTPPDIQTRAELGCAGVAGPLDNIQGPLTNALVSGLNGRPALAGTVGELGTLVVDTLDLVDAIAQTAGALNPNDSSNSAALLEPVLNQLLCTTAAVGETLLTVTLAATTPLADRQELNGTLDVIVGLQSTLQSALGQIANGGTVPAVASVLQQVTNTLGNVLASPLGLTTVPGGDAIVGVLQPVSTLLLEVSAALTALQAGNEAQFVDDLLGSVSNLIANLTESLGPLGVVLTTVTGLLTPVLALLDNLLTGLLGLVT